MTVEDIGKKLSARYNWENKSGLMTDIKDQLKQYNTEELDRIWFKFDTTYIANWPPKPAHFYGIAADLGLATNKNDGKFHACWVCTCGHMYEPLTVYLCPQCRSTQPKEIGDAAHPKCQHVNESSPGYIAALEKMPKALPGAIELLERLNIIHAEDHKEFLP